MACTLEDIKARIDAMPAALTEKGKRLADVAFRMEANASSTVCLSWQRPEGGSYRDGYEYIRAKDLADIPAALDAADAYIAALPSAEKAKMQEFMKALGSVIEQGRKLDIDVDFVNPLVETMKRLSKNALTDQRAA